jgi:alkanesulfonate monooxygenase SsuD/methylene tetrahydromethanopterin reductase-like flavin-dependent oxidoreductase (luciferase family)
MRVGLSWDLDRFTDSETAWKPVIDEIEQADKMGLESVWVHESREGARACSSPATFLTYAAPRTRSIQLRVASRHVGRGTPVHTAEEISVLDTMSRGRAGLSFKSAGAQGVAPGFVHETIDFVTAAWTYDDLRYRGDHVRFPAHTPDDAPAGASEPEAGDTYLPQWDWGPITPDFLAVTPKPYASAPPVSVEIDDDETLEWAAKNGIAPMVSADLPTEQAIDRLTRYRALADGAGRARREVEAVIERRLRIDGPGDGTALGGSTRDLVVAIGALRAKCGVSHFVWRRDGVAPMDLYRFASEVQPLLQA